jgi:hypothetical protein
VTTDNELLARIADETEGLRGDLEGNREADGEWETITRPLIAPTDFYRFAQASRAIARAHMAMCATGQGDWLRGNPIAPLFYRCERGEARQPYPVFHDAVETVTEVGEEIAYSLTRLHDAGLKLQGKHFAKERAILEQCALALSVAAESLSAAVRGDFDTVAYAEAVAKLEADEAPSAEGGK